MILVSAEKWSRPWVALAAGGAAIALLTAACFQLPFRILSLFYMAVIVVASMAGSIWASVVLALLAALCLDFFFTEPRFSLAVNDPADAIAVILFVGTGILFSNVVRQARRLGEAAAVKDQLQLVVDTIPAVVWSSLPDGSAEFLNRRFRDYSGLSGGEGRGLAWLDLLLHPEDRASLDWQAAMEAGEAFEREARLRSADNDYRRFLLRLAPLRGRDGTIIRWYASSTDIEDLKRAEEELRRQEATLREAQAELSHVNRVTTAGQLAASIGHEVAQPVAASVTNASAALRWLGAEPPDLEETRAALSRIVRDGRRAADIINRLRELVRKAPPRRERFDINDMILEVVALTQTELRRHGITPQTRLAAGLDPVDGDRVQLQQVLLNLILNAAEAMGDESEAERDLLITSDIDGAGEVRVAVHDSGPGLSAEHRDRLFDAFFTTKSGGMGMGLSICRTIIDAHGGRVWAAANEPRGAVFQFTLPRQTQPEAAG